MQLTMNDCNAWMIKKYDKWIMSGCDTWMKNECAV